MAAKASKSTAVKKAPVKKAKAGGAKAAARKKSGPHLTAVQWKAYRAAAQKVTRQQQSEALRLRRLRSAAKVTGKQAAAYYQRRRAKVAQNAVRRTFAQVAGSHQSAANRKRAARNVYRATQRATQARFVHEGIAIHAHRNRMQTLTSRQAQSAQARFSAAARRRSLASLKSRGAKKILKKAAARPRQPVKKPVPRGYSAQAKAAGLRAAAALGPVNSPGRRKPKAKRATRKAHARQTQKAVAKNSAKSAAVAAQSSKAKHAVPRKRAAFGVTPRVNPEWITAGNDDGTGNCVAVAVANHLLASTGYRMKDTEVMMLHWLGDDTIEGTLRAMSKSRAGWWKVAEYALADEATPGTLVGFEAREGPHAGLMVPGGQVISWGEACPLDSSVEEAWSVRWRT